MAKFGGKQENLVLQKCHKEPKNTTGSGTTHAPVGLGFRPVTTLCLLCFWFCKPASLPTVTVKQQISSVHPTSSFSHCVTWKWTNLAMLGSAMNIWCSRQQMRHCTSLKSLSRPPSGSSSSTPTLALGPRLPCFDFPGKGPLMLLSRLSVLAPSCCSSEVGRHTSRRIWTAALSWG